jgi:hypothetical protein
MDWIHLAQDRDMASSCEHNNEPSGSVKCWEFLEWLRNYWLFKKDSALWSQVIYHQMMTSRMMASDLERK